ncbi:MAG: hypothetical protein RIF41_29565, partial [Polyangiaceae bacterium]
MAPPAAGEDGEPTEPKSSEAAGQQPETETETHPGANGLDVEGVPEGTPVEIVAPPSTDGAPIVVVHQDAPPKQLPYDEGDPIPPGYELETKKYRGLIIGGAVTTGVLYGISAAVGLAGLAGGQSDAGVLLVPVAGPFIAAATLPADHQFR